MWVLGELAARQGLGRENPNEINFPTPFVHSSGLIDYSVGMRSFLGEQNGAARVAWGRVTRGHSPRGL